MRSFALSSGSVSNCFCIEGGDGDFILVDLGLSFGRMKEILDERDVDVFSVKGVLITHEHVDHVRGLEVFLNQVDCKIYLTKGTFEELGLEKDERFVFVREHDVFFIGGMRVFVLAKSHDAREPVSFVFESEGRKIGIFTDLGLVSDEMKHCIKSLDVVYLEANYCENMIKESKKHYSYVGRVVSDVGHLGLSQVISVLGEVLQEGQRIIFSHISENNNCYCNVYEKAQDLVCSLGKFVDVFVSFQGEPTEWIE